MIIPNIWKNVKCSKPPTRDWCSCSTIKYSKLSKHHRKNRYTLVIEHVNGKSSIYKWCSHSNPIYIGCSIAISLISIQISNKSDFHLHTKTSPRYGKPNMYRSLSQPETAVVFPYHCVSLPESNCDFQVCCFDPCPVQTSCSFGLPLLTGQRSCDDLRSNRSTRKEKVRWCLDA